MMPEFGCDEQTCCDLERGYEFLDKICLHLKMTKQTQPYIFKTCETAFPDKPGYKWLSLSRDDGLLRVHHLPDGATRRRVRVPRGSYNVQYTSGRVLTPSLERGTLSVLDERGRLLGRPTLAKAAHDVCFLAGG